MNPVLWQVREFDEIDSTNTYVANLAREGAAEGLVARADFQITTHACREVDDDIDTCYF